MTEPQPSPLPQHPDEPLLYATLDRLNISYNVIEHKPVFTCEESEGLDIDFDGAHTKQLFIRDKKKQNYVMAIVMHDKTVDIRALSEQLSVGRMSFASPDDLQKFLHITPGSVTPFGLLFDAEKKIRVVIDEDAWAIGLFRFHPLRNSATVNIDRDGFVKFLEETGHRYEILLVPQESNQEVRS